MPKKVPKSIRLSSKARKLLTVACAILVFLVALDVLSEAASAHPDPLTISDLRHAIGQAKAKAQGGTARDIQCLELTVQGYTSKEIGTIVGADPGTVRMWMTRARKYLKSLPELQTFGYPEVV